MTPFRQALEAAHQLLARLPPLEIPAAHTSLPQGLPHHSILRFPLAAILFFGNFQSVIKSFADDETGKVFNLKPSRKLPGEIQTRAKVKLDQLHAASELNHVRIPPSNRLKKLSGNLREFHSIRINQQWRIIFVWKDNHAHQVQITDYH